MILVNGRQLHNEMTRKVVSGNGAEVWKVEGHLSMGKEALVGEQGCGESKEKETSRGDGNLIEKKFKSITWRTSDKRTKEERRDMNPSGSMSIWRRSRAPGR